MVATVNVHEAKTHLPKLLARVEQGEEIVIARDGVPVARLVPVRRPGRRQPGWARGTITLAEDFDAPDAETERLLSDGPVEP